MGFKKLEYILDGNLSVFLRTIFKIFPRKTGKTCCHPPPGHLRVKQNKTNLYLCELSEQGDFHNLRTVDSATNTLKLTHLDMLSPLWPEEDWELA